MTPEKQKQKLAGQSSIAQKIFEHVPMAEEWTPSQVGQAMTQATGSRIDPKTIKGCLMTLFESGLVRVNRGLFQRIPVSQPQQTSTKEKSAMPTPKDTAPTTKAVAASAIDLLAGIAQKLREVTQELEVAALAIEESNAKNAEDVAKLHQLQALLKGLA